MITFKRIYWIFLLVCLSLKSFGQEASTGVRKALIVGISDYQEESLKLNYAASDAALFRDYLLKIEKLSEDQITYLNSNDPSSEGYAGALGIYNALDNLLEQAAPNDLIYIYFAGHGDVVKKIARYEGYLLATDANASQNYKGTGGVVALEDLNEYVAAITGTGAKVVLVLDACHSGFAFKEGSQKNMETLNESFLNSTKYFSCKPDEFSYESGDLGHGYFTYYLVLGLMGAADVDDTNLQYKELGEFLYTNVYNESEEKQTPLVVTQNPREVVKAVDPQFKKESMEIVKKSSSIKDLLASRSIQQNSSTSNAAEPHPIVKQFNAAMDREEYYDTEQSALSIYQNALKTNELSRQTLNKMQFALLKALSASAQMLINYYIEGHEQLPPAARFKKEAQNLEVCLSLMQPEAPLRERTYTGKLFLDAYAYIRAKNYSNYPKAKELLLEAVKLEPRAAYIHNALGVLYNQENQYQEAQHHYQEAHDLIPSWSYPVGNLGSNYFDQYQYQNAKRYYEEELYRYSDSITAYQNLGAISESQGKYAEAEALYLKSVNAKGELLPITLRNLGSLYEKKGNIRKALDYYEQALAKDPKDVYSYYNYSDLLIEEGIDIQKASRLLTDAINLEPFFARGHAQYADLLRRYSSDETSTQLAHRHYKDAIDYDPFYEWAYAGKGWLLHKQDQKEEALKSFELGITKNPNKPKSYYYLADYYKSGLKEVAKAEQFYLQAIQKDSFYLPAYKGLVDLYNDHKRQEESLVLLNKLISLDGEAPDTYNLLGNIYFSMGDNERAIIEYQNSLEVDSTYSKGLSNLAYSFLQTRKIEEAVAAYKKAITYNPYHNKAENFSLLMLSEGRRYKRDNNLEAAINLFQEALKLEVNYNTVTALAELYYFDNKPQQAQEVLKLINADALSKTRETKMLELLCKVAIDLKLSQQATESLAALKKINPRSDYLLEALVYHINGDSQQTIEALAQVKPIYFNEQLLKSQYSQNTLNLIKTLKP